MNQIPTDVPEQQYRTVQVETSTTLDLVQMAYDGIVDNLRQAVQALKSEPKSLDVFNEKVSKAQQIVSALDDGINEDEGELSALLTSFYEFIRTKLIESNMQKSLDGIEEALLVVEQVRGFWAESSKLDVDIGTRKEDNVKIDISG